MGSKMTNGIPDPILFADVYQEPFIRRSHELVAMGHKRLVRKQLADMEETVITGMLCDAMEAALDASDAPDWATHVTTVDDQPESVDNKTGKRRPRTDICVRCINPRPASRFRFEAKRLQDSQSIGKYLGKEGMLALIEGHYGNLPYAGMIGYVQCESCAIWTARIKAAMEKDPKSHYAKSPIQFTPLLASDPEGTFVSRHDHRGPRTISHTLLLCA